MVLLRILVVLCGCLSLAALSLQEYEVRVTDQKPQAREHFVQGLEIVDGYLYLSAGNFGQSRLLRYHFDDLREDISRPLATEMFAEGLTIFGDKVYQLTWRNRMMLVYRKSDLQFQQRLPLSGEGWGLTHNDSQLIYSDGTDKLHFMSPDTGRILRSIAVTQEARPVTQLNELEWINGAIWANVWQSDRIVIIDPSSGEVTGTIDLRGLLPPDEYRSDTDVLNGIARNPADGAIWVTGKRWPWLYRIELVPAVILRETQQNELKSR